MMVIISFSDSFAFQDRAILGYRSITTVLSQNLLAASEINGMHLMRPTDRHADVGSLCRQAHDEQTTPKCLDGRRRGSARNRSLRRAPCDVGAVTRGDLNVKATMDVRWTHGPGARCMRRTMRSALLTAGGTRAPAERRRRGAGRCRRARRRGKCSTVHSAACGRVRMS